MSCVTEGKRRSSLRHGCLVKQCKVIMALTSSDTVVGRVEARCDG